MRRPERHAHGWEITSLRAHPDTPLSRRSALVHFTAFALTPSGLSTLSRSDDPWDDVQQRAFRFFVEQADPKTGLVKDRADNSKADSYTVASIASTGYGLAALAVGLRRGWIAREAAMEQALRSLRFLLTGMRQENGWTYHFVDMRTGERVWDSEISTIDTALLVAGALVCGEALGGEARGLANQLYDRLDWHWAMTNDGSRPEKRTLTHGWKPEEGFLPYEWDSYSEGLLLYLLGLGARNRPLPRECWASWPRATMRYAGWESLQGGPIFLHQMPHNFFPLRERRCRLGWDYWVSAVNATFINRQYCLDQQRRAGDDSPAFWGLNASDGPSGYKAYGVFGSEDGTYSPTGMLASAPLAPQLCAEALGALKAYDGGRLLGKYGFANAFNPRRSWVSPDVIGIDLGMALLAIENHRSGHVWKLMERHPLVARAYGSAGLRRTREPLPRKLRVEALAQNEGGRD